MWISLYRQRRAVIGREPQRPIHGTNAAPFRNAEPEHDADRTRPLNPLPVTPINAGRGRFRF
jgi:hypothetical protein